MLWPAFLLLLGLIPLIVLAYVWILKRRKRYAVHYSSLSLIREAQPGRSRWRRHLPFALFLLALASLVLALARPVTTLNVMSSRSTIVLALDVSLSMCSTDIAPNRLTVAQESAETFIRNQHRDTKIGLVAFAGFAELIVPPTADKEVLLEAVRGLTAGLRTAVGSAIVRSLDAIAEVNDAVAPVNVFMRPAESAPDPMVEGAYQPDIIVLLTDGASNSGVDPLGAAQAAADRGVRVYTIGYGTPRGSVFRCTPEQMEGIELGTGFRRAGFGGGLGRGFRRGLDDYALRQVATLTDAEYYLAESAEDLLDVFADVPSHLVTAKATTELSAVFTAVGALFALIAFALALRWQPISYSVPTARERPGN
ncbi:MAG: VWA domain-containing protein [Chloroflexi bacterium]|nr:VWA domain-containing protein [Chloroflexota bacterium]